MGFRFTSSQEFLFSYTSHDSENDSEIRVKGWDECRRRNVFFKAFIYQLHSQHQHSLMASHEWKLIRRWCRFSIQSIEVDFPESYKDVLMRRWGWGCEREEGEESEESWHLHPLFFSLDGEFLTNGKRWKASPMHETNTRSIWIENSSLESRL